ncbi:MAG: PQQ-dependent sugar dehydrogenase [Acidobacteriota bacterium]|nr:PQQ-dependent sugar dehydrogenase [Acidobacteriota bacterium]
MSKSNAKAIFIGLLLLILNFTINLSSPRAQTPYQTQQVVGNLALPNHVTSARDGSGRLFILLKSGLIKVHNPATGATTDFLDITSRVLTTNTVNSERGLLGLAFHPQFQQNRRFFVYYTRQPDGAIQVGEYRVSASNPNVAETIEKTIITIPHAENSNHNGGTVAFGPDGYLYLAPGDGGSQNDPPNNAQNLNVLLGKMLRIDVNVPEGSAQPYLIPPDNPFAGATPGADEIYAYGFRNPYRFSFDRAGSRQLYIGDVGQNQIEEIDIGQRGANYGWRVYEGTNCTGNDPQLCAGGATPLTQTPPIFQYTHTGGRCSITGGFVYRGRRGTFPQGAYVYGDYCSGEIWMLLNGNNTLVLDTAFFITSFGEDDQGEIYFTTNSTTAGTVQKLVNPNAVAPRRPIADFDGDGITDLSVFRPSQGVWYINDSSLNRMRAVHFGTQNDQPVPADFDGDGKTDIAVFRNGFWYSLNSSNNAFRAFQFGTTGDIPVAGDYDGDGSDDYAVYRNNFWYIWQSSNNQFRAINWGLTGDKPVPADYDGDDKTDVAVVRGDQSGALIWYVLQSSNNSLLGLQWGGITHTPVPADYDGDRKADFAVIVNNQTFYIRRSSNNTLQTATVLSGTNTPAIGDFDGDGKADPTVTFNYADTTKGWQIVQSTNNVRREVQYGLAEDLPIPAREVP